MRYEEAHIRNSLKYADESDMLGLVSFYTKIPLNDLVAIVRGGPIGLSHEIVLLDTFLPRRTKDAHD